MNVSRPEAKSCGGVALIDELLTKLLQGSAHESSGEFSLDPLRQLESLQKLQIQQPWLYLLNLIQAATILSAARIDLDCDPQKLVLRYPFYGLSLNPEEEPQGSYRYLKQPQKASSSL